MSGINGYTLDDMVAMAVSRNVSYGKIQACLLTGTKLPPLRTSTKWPKGSEHFGEEVLGQPDAVRAYAPPEPKQAETHVKRHGNAGKRIVKNKVCDHCGKGMDAIGSHLVYVHAKGDRNHCGVAFARLCNSCAAEYVPATKPAKSVRETFLGPDGKRVQFDHLAYCFACCTLHDKTTGVQVYDKLGGDTVPALRGYLCKGCAEPWKKNVKK